MVILQDDFTEVLFITAAMGLHIYIVCVCVCVFMMLYCAITPFTALQSPSFINCLFHIGSWDHFIYFILFQTNCRVVLILIYFIIYKLLVLCI